MARGGCGSLSSSYSYQQAASDHAAGIAKEFDDLIPRLISGTTNAQMKRGEFSSADTEMLD